MDSKIYLISLFICFCTIELSFALKCFTCNSDSFSKCNDLSNDALQPQDCSVEAYRSRDDKLLDHLGYGGIISETTVPTCLKFVSSQKTGEKYINRLCTFKTQKTQDICAVARTKLLKSKDDTVEFCGTCEDKDGCNSSNQIKLFYSLIVFGTMVTTARLFV